MVAIGFCSTFSDYVAFFYSFTTKAKLNCRLEEKFDIFLIVLWMKNAEINIALLDNNSLLVSQSILYMLVVGRGVSVEGLLYATLIWKQK